MSSDLKYQQDSDFKIWRSAAAREGRLLVPSFHPELTQDNRLHCYFIAERAALVLRAVEKNSPV